MSRRVVGNEGAVSAVVGCMLLVAITLLVTGALVLGTKGFRGESPPPEAAGATFRIVPFDFDGNRKDDRVKIVYTRGPTTLPDAWVRIEATQGDGEPEPVPPPDHLGDWQPSNFVLYRPTCAIAPCSVWVSVSVGVHLVTQERVTLEE